MALRCASSKLIPPTAFFAPSFDDFGALGAVVEDDSLDETAGRVDPGADPGARREDEVTVRETGLAPIEGGAAALGAVVDAAWALGFSLSHVEKKSSDAAGVGAGDPSGVSSRPSIWIP